MAHVSPLACGNTHTRYLRPREGNDCEWYGIDDLPITLSVVQGYYTDTRTMSYDWIQENIYFSGILLFSSFYYSFRTKDSSGLAWPIEVID